MSIEYARFHFNVDQFERMGESGILTEDDRVELIDGELITMSPIGSRHLACVNALNALLILSLQRKAIVSVQNPVRLNDDTEPLPDITVLRPKKNGYRDALPTGKDVLIAIEVSDTTVLYDRTVKIPRYARAGVKESWLVDLKTKTVEVHWAARKGQYTKNGVCRTGDVIQSQSVKELAVAVADILA